MPPLGSEALNIGFKVETMADLLPREVDFPNSVFRGVPVPPEPTFACQVLEKTSRPLSVPFLGSEALNIGFMVETAANFTPREEDFFAKYPSSKSPEMPAKC